MSEAGDEGKTAKLLIGGNLELRGGRTVQRLPSQQRALSRHHHHGRPGSGSLLLNIKQGQYVPGHGHVYYSKRVKPKYVDTMAKKYGRDSAIFDVRVRGIFPRSADDVVIPWSWANAMRGGALPLFDPVADAVTLVVDPSRGGGAETAIGMFRRGYCFDLNAFKNGSTSTTPVINAVQEAVLKIVTMGLRLNEIIVDEPGIGGGVIDELRRAGLAGARLQRRQAHEGRHRPAR